MIKTFPDASPSKGKLVTEKQQSIQILTKKNSSAARWGKSFFVLGLISGLLSLNSCKDPDETGLNILPSSDQLNMVYSDTSTIITTTVLEDSLQTDELSSQLIGSMNHPVFGISTASVYAQAVLTGGTPSFGTAPVADSIVLALVYSGYYGDTNQTQVINVSRLTEDMHIDSSYFSNRTFTTDATLLGTTSFLPAPNTRVVVDSDTIIPQVRIRLDQSLADSIIALNGQSTLASNDSWLTYFKGLNISAAPMTVAGRGAICSFNFFSSALILYFHDGTTSKKYAFSLANARLNHFDHDYTGTSVAQALNTGTTDSLSYIQGICGVKTKISFPFLKHFKDSGSILVNRAELKVIAQDPTIPFYGVPNKLLLVSKNAAGENIFPIDYYESSGYFGGDYYSTDKEYTFNIARQIQGYLDDRYVSADFFIVVSGSGVTPNQLVLGSSTSTSQRLKLTLYYTKLY